MFAGGGQPSWAMTLACVADTTAYCNNNAKIKGTVHQLVQLSRFAEFGIFMNMSLKLIMEARLYRTDFDSRVLTKIYGSTINNTRQHNKITRAKSHKA